MAAPASAAAPLLLLPAAAVRGWASGTGAQVAERSQSVRLH